MKDDMGEKNINNRRNEQFDYSFFCKPHGKKTLWTMDVDGNKVKNRIL
jgi:hypothetical protein